MSTDRYWYRDGTERFDIERKTLEVYRNGEWLIWLPPHPVYVDGKLTMPPDTKNVVNGTDLSYNNILTTNNR
jgi:hypothetical protein